MKNSIIAILLMFVFCNLLQNCKQNNVTIPKKTIVRIHPKTIAYHFENTKEWLKQNKSEKLKLNIVLAINRTDEANISKMDSIIIPKDFSGDLVYYLPFPEEIPYLKEVDKIIFFSYPSQTFAAYKNGDLVYTGPTNMGRKKDPTPTGLFFTNWKAEKTTSTFNDEWDLKWNFNIENKLGVGFHEYSLPGYPASHSCLRLQEKDAEFLYNWADQWILETDQKIKVKGTPVIVFGTYNFDAPKPWYELVINPKALNISKEDLQKETTPYLETILQEQKKRVNQK